MNSENFDLHKKIEQQRKSLTKLVERIKKKSGDHRNENFLSISKYRDMNLKN
jgi:cell division protein FtsL